MTAAGDIIWTCHQSWAWHRP